MPSWTDIYQAERDGLVRLAYLMTGSPAVAEDLVQDTFLRVMARLDADSSPGAYLRRSVINACYSWHRRAWREVKPGDDELLGAATPGGWAARSRPGATGRSPTLARPAEPGPGPDIEMWDALSRLAPRRRSVLVMRYYLDMSKAEVAETLGCRVGTVKSTTHRALAELRRMIER